jgi:hypothetical protein
MVKDCCKDPANLSTVALDEKRSVSTCQVCGCRHYRIKADPGQLGVRGAGMGA